MAAPYPPLNTSFPNPTDVDAGTHPSRDIENYGVTTLSVPVYAQAPGCAPTPTRNLAVPAAPLVGNFTGTPPAAPASQPQPVDPAFL